MAWNYTQIPLQPLQSHQGPYYANVYPSSQPFYHDVAQPPPYVSQPYKETTHLITEIKERRRRRVDYTTACLLLAVWALLTSSCIILLYLTHVATAAGSYAGRTVTAGEIAQTILISSLPGLLATILNEALVDRCWRRVAYSALGKNAARYSDAQLARRLRAANFEWLNITKRLWTHELSLHDFRAMISYGLLRWGTAISIASIQLCVSWDSLGEFEDDQGSIFSLYSAKKRIYFLILPVFLHSVSIFGMTTLCFMAPWTLFSGRFDDEGLLQRYRPYLERVRNGSIAKYEAVAMFLDPRGHSRTPLGMEHTPGIQFMAKLRGIWLGLLLTFLAPILAYAYTSMTQRHGEGGLIRNGVYRFGFHLVFLAQNIFYILALDFVIWNLNLEGFSKNKHSKEAKPNKNLRLLGYSSGLVLLSRAFKQLKQGRPIRAALFLWLFWFQACLMRGLTVLYAFCLVIFRYGTRENRQSFYDPGFWLEYSILTAVLVLPLFLLWLFTSFKVPICAQDGWRWAKIADNALYMDGFYGVRNGEAVWGMDVLPFGSTKTELLA